MEPKTPAWLVGLTAFIALGICCAGAILTGPAWAHLVPDLPRFPTRSPTATPTQTPTATLTPPPTLSPTPSPTLPAALRFPTLSPEERYTPEPTPAPAATRPAPPNYRFPGQGNSVISFSLSEGGAVRFVFSHTGESNFIIRLLDEGGNYAGGIANEIGNTNGETVEGLEAGEWFLEIEADGQWLVNIVPP